MIPVHGQEGIQIKSEVIRSGVNTYEGRLTNRNVASAHNYEYTDLQELI